MDAPLIGVDVGGTKCQANVIDAQHHIVDSVRVPTVSGGVELVELVASVVEALAARHEVGGVGIGLPGLLDLEGRLQHAPNLEGADGLMFGELVAERCGLPVRVDNDANCAARGELVAGGAVGVSEAVMLTLGTGLGAAVVVGGEVYLGAHGLAGEIGHMIVDPSGPACPCGRTGCWEQMGSGSALGRLARDAAATGRADDLVSLAGTAEQVRGEHVTEAARAGGVGAMAVVEEYAGWLALGVSNLVAMLDPELVLFGGGVADDWDLYGPAISAGYEPIALIGSQRPPVRLVPARLGSTAGTIGAAALLR